MHVSRDHTHTHTQITAQTHAQTCTRASSATKTHAQNEETKLKNKLFVCFPSESTLLHTSLGKVVDRGLVANPLSRDAIRSSRHTGLHLCT
mmetsp:Transcript_10247/g.18104  ORF Transcript_10247/g.18104 Transcript_10247/m.18104 type:complete len:91 (-) Transcript_10247:51-323(-)